MGVDTEVHQAIQPAFQQYIPYLVPMVELDRQSGKPTKEGLRVIGNLTRPDGVLAPKSEVEPVGIGTRVRMMFTKVASGPARPQWTIAHPLCRLPPSASTWPRAFFQVHGVDANPATR
jgi:hypothetical protein